MGKKWAVAVAALATCSVAVVLGALSLSCDDTGGIFGAQPPWDGGSLIWAKRAGGSDGDLGFGIAVLPDGSAFVTGLFQGTATFGPGEANETALTPAGLSDIFVARYDADGTLAWAKRAGGTSSDSGEGIAVLSDGSAFVTGSFQDTATFGPGELNETPLTSAGSTDVFVARYNADGGLAWAKRAGGSDIDTGYGIAVLSDGSALVTGFFYDAATFGPGESNETTLTAGGSADVFVARYNADGTLAWAKQAGGSITDHGWGIGVLSDGSAFVTGCFGLTATFGPGESNETPLTSAVGYDIFIARYNPDGTLAWAKRAEGSNAEGGGIAVLSDGSAFVTGAFWDTAMFGPGESNETTLTSEGTEDIFIARYNADGTLAWAKRAGGSDWDWGYGVAGPSDGSALVTGCFEGTATFGPGEANETTLTSEGWDDIFIARYNADGSLAWAKGAGWSIDDNGLSIAVLPDGSAFVTGYFGGPVTFGPGEANETTLASDGWADVFIARFKP